MPPKIAPPKPRHGTQRHRISHQRIDAPAGSPAPFRASTPVRQSPAGTPRPQPRTSRKCPDPDCPNPKIVLADDSSWVCETCGKIAEEVSNLVGEQQFTEGPGGRVTAAGVTVAPGETHARAPGSQRVGNVGGGEPKPSAATALKLAQNVFRSHMNNLKYHSTEVEIAASRIFQLAHNQAFFRGRSLRNFATVCLYLALRRQTEQIQGVKRPKFPVLLIDLAELENTDVFALGAMYRDLVYTLFPGVENNRRVGISGTWFGHEELLAHGPEMFIDRFVNRMEFPEASRNKIKQDSIRIVRQMSRDWMSTGRRPAGVCGAAILLAARMNNYRRTTREVVLQAKVAEITINKRLEEFSDTASGKLSITDFRDNNVLNGLIPEDPPAYTQGINPRKRKRRKGRPKGNGPETATDIEGDTADTQTVDSESQAKRPRIDAEGFAIPELPQKQNTVEASNSSQKPKLGRPKGAKNWRAPPITAAEQAIEEQLERDIDLTLEEIDPSHVSTGRNATPAPQPSVAAEPGTELETEQSTPEANQVYDPQDMSSSDQQPGSSTANTTVATQDADRDQYYTPRKRNEPPGPPVNTTIGNLNNVSLSPTIKPGEFSDDEEVFTCLLSEPERRVKEIVWVNNNADWLRQDHAKRIKRELKDAEMRRKGQDPDEIRRQKAMGKQKQRKDGRLRVGKRGDASYLHQNEPGVQREKPSKTPGDVDKDMQDGEEGDEQDNQSDRSTPNRPTNAAESVRRFLQHRGMHSTRVNFNALESIYGTNVSSPTSGSRSPTRPASTSISPQVQRKRHTLGREEPNPENILFGAQGGKFSGLARSKSSLSAERREARRRVEKQRADSGGSGSPTPGPSGQTASPGADQSPDDGSPEVEDEFPNIPRNPVGRPESVHRAALPGKGSGPRLRAATRPQLRSRADETHTPTPAVQSTVSSQSPTSTVTVMDDGSTEELVGSLPSPSPAAERATAATATGGERNRSVSVVSDASGQIRMRERTVDEDEISDEDEEGEGDDGDEGEGESDEDEEDDEEEDEDEENEDGSVDDGLEEAFEGRYQRRRAGEEDDEDE